ncbi:hypothetical protein A5N86_06940 [Geobacillus thermoleovorans]|uniref:DUF3800 domain-containing protein n=1 Tax=Geobacillus thermoleovorans TaxID=33941 RepID=UPI00083B4E0C|nr:DUF3800 domain-containing protein [Geobacillus thermoleovorans]ODA17982.1 hypothetical protein A5N86_06940 [Geobacillus thermoleovorans]
MYLLYIDESGNTKTKKDPVPSPDGGNSLYFVLGAVLIHARSLEKIERQLWPLKETFLKNPWDELKFSIELNKLRNDKKRDEYRIKLCEFISKANLTLFAVGVNKHVLFQQGVIASKDDTYHLAFQHLVSLINGYMIRNKIKDPITVFIDHINEANDEKIYRAYKQALENESLFPNFDKSIFSPSINFAISKFTLGLQLSDLVVGSIWRSLEAGDKRFAKLIKNKFPSSDDGNPLNYGYKVCDTWLIKNK